MYKAKLVVRVHALKEMCLAFIKTVVITFSSAFLTSFCGMLARTPRGQRLILENGALLSLINRFTARHTKTPLPPTPILTPPNLLLPLPLPPLPPPSSSEVQKLHDLLFTHYVRDFFCFVSFYSFSPKSLYLLVGVIHTQVHLFDTNNLAMDSFHL